MKVRLPDLDEYILEYYLVLQRMRLVIFEWKDGEAMGLKIVVSAALNIINMINII